MAAPSVGVGGVTKDVVGVWAGVAGSPKKVWPTARWLIAESGWDGYDELNPGAIPSPFYQPYENLKKSGVLLVPQIAATAKNMASVPGSYYGPVNALVGWTNALPGYNRPPMVGVWIGINGTDCWIEFDLGANYLISKYQLGSMCYSGDYGYSPSDWTLSGWASGHRGDAATLLDTQAAYPVAHWTTPPGINQFTLATPMLCRYLRVAVTDTCSHNLDNVVVLSNIDFFGG